MKKVIMILTLFTVIVGCKPKESTEIPEPTTPIETEDDPISCAIRFAEIIKKNPTEITNDEASEILKCYGERICEDEILLREIISFHKINDSEKNTKYDKLLSDFWGDLKNVQYKEIKWVEIKKLLENHCYEKYISFDFDESKNDKIDIKSVDNFTEHPSCYSIALFKSINLNYKDKTKLNISDTATFKFAKAKDAKGKTIIVFETENLSVASGYYDISAVPLIDTFNWKEFIKKASKK